jgi:TctA family transporter
MPIYPWHRHGYLYLERSLDDCDMGVALLFALTFGMGHRRILMLARYYAELFMRVHFCGVASYSGTPARRQTADRRDAMAKKGLGERAWNVTVSSYIVV